MPKPMLPNGNGKQPVEDTDLKAKVEANAKEALIAAYTIADKMERQAAVAEVRKAAIESLCDEKMKLRLLQLTSPEHFTNWKNSWFVTISCRAIHVLTDVT